MSDDSIRNLARIFATIVKEHGVEEALQALPEDVYWKLYTHFANVVQEDKK